MDAAALLERIVALQTGFDDAHRRVVQALQSNDLRSLVEAAHAQGELCSEQGALLAEYVAIVAVQSLELSEADRTRVTELARQLRSGRDGAERTQAAG